MLDLDYHSWSKVVEHVNPIKGIIIWWTREREHVKKIDFFLEYYVDTWHRIFCDMEE